MTIEAPAPTPTPTPTTPTPMPPSLPAAATSAPPASSPSDWLSSLSEESKGYIQVKGFKDPAAVVESYINLEKLHGVPAENLLKLPTKDDDVEGWNQVHTRLGRPAKAEDYKIPAPAQGQTDENFSNWAKNAFHQAGLSTKQAEKLATQFNEFAATSQAQQQQVSAQAGKTAEAELKREWGGAYEQNMRLIDKAAVQLGMKDEHLAALRQAMGPAAAVKFVHNLAVSLGGEDKFVGGAHGGFNGALTPGAAQSKIKALKSDKEFTMRYINGDVKALEEMELLHKFAYPEELG